MKYAHEMILDIVVVVHAGGGICAPAKLVSCFASFVSKLKSEIRDRASEAKLSKLKMAKFSKY